MATTQRRPLGRELSASRTNASLFAGPVLELAADTIDSEHLDVTVPTACERKRLVRCKERPWLTIAFQVQCCNEPAF